MHVVWQTWHEPFGATVALSEDPDGDGTNVVLNLRFSNQYYDAETGLHYNWHRFYDPVAGRYLEPDVIFVKQGKLHLPELEIPFSMYSYARNSPLAWVDPEGLATVQVGPTLCAILGIATGSWSQGVAFDFHGNIGFYEAIGGGEAQGAWGSGGIGLWFSTADTIYDLAGPFTNVSAGAGDELAASVDGFFGPSDNGFVYGLGFTVGIGAGVGSSVSVTTTDIGPAWNPFE